MSAWGVILLLSVLIESDWNLKKLGAIACYGYNNVLIESDWNLKDIQPQVCDVRL